MRGIEGEQVLLRLILSESRTHDGKPLYRTLVELLRADGFAGATVLKGVAGFEALMSGGVIMTERAKVIRYARSREAPS